MDLIYVLSAAVVGFIFTIVWRACFSKALANGWKQESSNLNIKCPKYMLISFIGSLWVSYGVFLLIKHIKPNSNLELFTSIFALWFLVLVGLNTKYYVAAKVSSSICFIHSFGSLFQLIIVAFILGY